jgi:zinc protease
LIYQCASALIGGPSAFAKPPVVPETAPLAITAPDFHVKTLSCGMKVLFLKDDHLPLVSGELLAPGGFVTDPVGKEGLVGLLSGLLRSGGAGPLAPEAFDAALENKAISMGASADTENFSADFKCLAGDLPEVLGYFADMLRRPQFDAKRLETAKANSMDSLKRLEDTPDTLTRVLFYRTLMGHSPYGRWASPKSVGSITRDDLLQFYQKNFGPQGSILALAGNLDEEKTTARLEELFSGWRSATSQAPNEDAKPLGPTIYFFPKEVTQAFVRLGFLGIKRHDPQDIPLQVANYILGGSGFTSRMMQEIRSDRGLAYFVYSYSLPFNVRGPYQILGGTRPDSVQEYLTLMLQLAADFAKIGPTERELEDAKKSLIEEYAYNFESPYTLAGYKASLDFHGYPDDYLKTYRDKVKAVTQAQATQAARSILSQKDWVLVVCGPEELEPVLASFGKVQKVTGIFDPLEK